MNFLISLLKYWREASIVLLIGACWYFHADSGILTEKLRMSQEKITEETNKNYDLQSRLDIQSKATAEQAKAQQEAEAKRLQIISTLSSQVNTLRKQTPPTECSAAVVWSIQHKDDLKWPK